MMRWRLALICLAVALAHDTQAGERVSIASFNIWGGGLNTGEPVDGTVRALRAIDADIFALQEVRAESAEQGASVAPALAEALGYHLHEQVGDENLFWASAILSRYPIETVLDDGFGLIVKVNNRRIAVLNAHFTDYPYQPYQLLGIPYGESAFLSTAEAAVEAAEAARGEAVDQVLAVAGSLNDVELVVICGDFNEPSHLDWTENATTAGLHPMPVAYPASRKMAAAGFIDTWRKAHPDEVVNPGFTWTPTAAANDTTEHHDRIDYVYVKGRGGRVISAEVAGESAALANIVVTPWPSDHRAVKATLQY